MPIRVLGECEPVDSGGASRAGDGVWCILFLRGSLLWLRNVATIANCTKSIHIPQPLAGVWRILFLRGSLLWLRNVATIANCTKGIHTPPTPRIETPAPRIDFMGGKPLACPARARSQS